MFILPRPGAKYYWYTDEVDEEGFPIEKSREMQLADINPVIIESLAKFAPVGTDENMIPELLLPYLYVIMPNSRFNLDTKIYNIDAKDVMWHYDYYLELFYDMSSVFDKVYVVIDMVYNEGDNIERELDEEMLFNFLYDISPVIPYNQVGVVYGARPPDGRM